MRKTDDKTSGGTLTCINRKLAWAKYSDSCTKKRNRTRSSQRATLWNLER